MTQEIRRESERQTRKGVSERERFSDARARAIKSAVILHLLAHLFLINQSKPNYFLAGARRMRPSRAPLSNRRARKLIFSNPALTRRACKQRKYSRRAPQSENSIGEVN
jgi:hypothetical protein